MHCPPVCLSCGAPIGDVADEYRALLQRRIEELRKKTGITADRIREDASVDIEAMSILEDLHVDADCCRTHITTSIEFRDYY